MQIIADHEYQNLSCCHSFGTVKLYWLENVLLNTVTDHSFLAPDTCKVNSKLGGGYGVHRHSQQ